MVTLVLIYSISMIRIIDRDNYDTTTTINIHNSKNNERLLSVFLKRGKQTKKKGGKSQDTHTKTYQIILPTTMLPKQNYIEL
jgi:hypothetical protein